ncbi:hypothetical protein EW026_g190 [Hermanssonia centrifuga]|uniref:J domain-containing protein n=1 Tax=Hermanssonia centrifuga TaxID=98765 RepID=A0A4S4KVU5_9APHY|nr:hypothetical protein EW026_g190 [Hermanssonia centrifuga]
MGLTGNSRSLYDVLGIHYTAAPETVRKAYKRMILETHPVTLPKRRVYDNGLNYIRARARSEETQAKITRERAEWHRRCQQRQEERMRMMTERMRAKQERQEQRVERLRQMDAEKQAQQERMRALEEELQINYEKNQEMILRSEMKYLERMKALEEELRMNRKMVLESRRTILQLPENKENADDAKAEKLLDELRKMNPEWEIRRQAILRRRAERTNSTN